MDLIKEHPDLIAAIRDLEAAPVAVVLDTLNRSLTGSENSDEDMGAYIKATDAIREAFDCSVLVVHHCGINDSRPRGHTSLTGPQTPGWQSHAMQPKTSSLMLSS